MSRERGFTLIELLVVIAVIIILISILMPSLQQARELARMSVCMANQHAIATAEHTYMADGNNHFAIMRQWIPTNHQWCDPIDNLRTGLIFPYIKSDKVFMCPTFDRVCGTSTATRSYTRNGNLGYADPSSTDVTKHHCESVLRDSDLRRPPGSMLWFTEENTWTIPSVSMYSANDPQFITYPNKDSAGVMFYSRDTVATYHLAKGDLNKGAGLVAFVDCHVERLDDTRNTRFLVNNRNPVNTPP